MAQSRRPDPVDPREAPAAPAPEGPRTGGRALRRIVYTPEQIAERVREMGVEIAEAFPDGEDVLLILHNDGALDF